jgi:toxin ParE1/3/4
MKYIVIIIKDAEADIFDIYKYVAYNDGIEKAEYLLDKIEKTCEGLSRLPRRGHIPPELKNIGIFDFLEIHFKPYRIIYQILDTQVFIHCVLDGRRELQDLLQQRLLRND